MSKTKKINNRRKKRGGGELNNAQLRYSYVRSNVRKPSETLKNDYSYETLDSITKDGVNSFLEKEYFSTFEKVGTLGGKQVVAIFEPKLFGLRKGDHGRIIKEEVKDIKALIGDNLVAKGSIAYAKLETIDIDNKSSEYQLTLIFKGYWMFLYNVPQEPDNVCIIINKKKQIMHIDTMHSDKYLIMKASDTSIDIPSLDYINTFHPINHLHNFTSEKPKKPENEN